MRITVFRRRGPSSVLLKNYLARAQAIASAGGGNLWLIEPALTPDRMSAFTEAVVRHLTTHGIVTGEIAVLEGRTSARIAVLAAPTVEITLPAESVSSPSAGR